MVGMIFLNVVWQIVDVKKARKMVMKSKITHKMHIKNVRIFDHEKFGLKILLLNLSLIVTVMQFMVCIYVSNIFLPRFLNTHLGYNTNWTDQDQHYLLCFIVMY